MDSIYKWIVYLTVNTVNNKTYIGVHKTDRDDFDGYIGCGVNINRPATYKKSKTPFQYAVNKYGIDKFIRIISKFRVKKVILYKICQQIFVNN